MSEDLAPSVRKEPNRAAAARGDVAMIVVNVLGMLVYLWMAHYAWAIPEERAAGIYTVTGEPFIWALGVLPVWAVFFLLDGVWAVVIIRRRPQRGRLSFALVSALWVLAYVADYIHH